MRPKLIILANASGREEQYTDWNGAVVWNGAEEMSELDIYFEFLMGTGLTLMIG